MYRRNKKIDFQVDASVNASASNFPISISNSHTVDSLSQYYLSSFISCVYHDVSRLKIGRCMCKLYDAAGRIFLFYFPAESFIELLRTELFYKGNKGNVLLAFLKSDQNGCNLKKPIKNQISCIYSCS